MKKRKWVYVLVLFFIPWMMTSENSSRAAYPERAIEIIVPFGVGGGATRQSGPWPRG